MARPTPELSSATVISEPDATMVAFAFSDNSQPPRFAVIGVANPANKDITHLAVEGWGPYTTEEYAKRWTPRTDAESSEAWKAAVVYPQAELQAVIPVEDFNHAPALARTLAAFILSTSTHMAAEQ